MQRIQQQISAAALWVELDSDLGGAMDDLLVHVSRDVGDGRYAAVVSATAELIDPVAASLAASGVELIIDADDAERAAAFAMAMLKHGLPLHVSDVASDNNAERLRQLSEEVSRIASTLARLSTGPGAPVRPVEQSTAGTYRLFPPKQCDQSFVLGACALVISAMTCSPIPRGTCCLTCCRRKSPSFACPYRACVSLRLCPRRLR